MLEFYPAIFRAFLWDDCLDLIGRSYEADDFSSDCFCD